MTIAVVAAPRGTSVLIGRPRLGTGWKATAAAPIVAGVVPTRL